MRPIQAFTLVRERAYRREHSSRKAKRLLRNSLVTLLALASTAVALAVIVLAFYYTGLTANLPPVDELPVLLNAQNGSLLQPTQLYDRTGQHLIYSLENPGIPRRFLGLESSQGEAFSPVLVQTILAIEDPNYNNQRGLRWSHLADSTPCTIAEKLVSDLLMGADASAGLRRSLRMRLLADQAVSRYGSDQILDWYLNSAYFGHLAYGVDSAAWLYLGKPASQLNLAESALLAAVLDAPALNPLDAPAAARENQQKILQYLLVSGAINTEEYQAALNTALVLRTSLDASQSIAPAFSNLVLDQLNTQIERERLERGGLRIITSLDYDLQEQATCTLQTQLDHLAGSSAVSSLCPAANLLPSLPLSTPQNLADKPLAASAVILDPQNGQVLALVGDTSLQTAGASLHDHPAGSLQTPFLALAGFARSLSPATLVWDIPSSLPGYTEPDGTFHGPLRLRTALANDYLVPLTQTLLQVGADTLSVTAQTVGLNDFSLPKNAEDTFFSGQPLSPLEIAHAYGVFATLGQLNGQASSSPSGVAPVLFQRVEEDASGTVLLSNQTVVSRPVVSSQLAYLVHDVLADESARWPSLGYPNPLEIGRPAGAKTGWADAGQSTWAAGYTRQSLAVVWLGYETEDPAYPDLGTLPAAGIWHALIQYTSRSQPALVWEQPAGISQVQVCDPSGLLPTSDCPNVVNELFLNGNEPTGLDNLYQSFQINRETGRLATVFTPPELVEEKTYLVVPPEDQEWSSLADLPAPPSDYDAIQAPAVNPQVNFSQPQQFSFVHGKVSLSGTATASDFSSYSLQTGQGINPTAWVTIAQSSTPVQDGVLGEWDTSGLNGLYVLRLQLVHTGQRVEYALLQVTVDNTPPQVKISYPQDGQVFSDPTQRSLTLPADVSDNIGIQRVEWWLDGQKLGERSAAPYALVYQASPGPHSLVVRAYDQAGNEAESQKVTFSVK